MPASPLNFDATEITNAFGWFWVGMAIPAAGARASLFTDGTPDSTANPNAKHMGHTTEGWESAAAAEAEDYTLDESPFAVKSSVATITPTIAANLAQTADISGVLQYIVQGFGTYSAGAGYEQITGGIIPIVYTSVALIWPQEADPTKMVIYHLYKSRNTSGLANQIKRRGLGSNPVSFQGYGITSRASADQAFNYWRQIA